MGDLPSRRRLAAIVNPVSGRRSMLTAVHRIRELIEQTGGHLEVLVSDYAGHAIELAAGLDGSIEAVLIVGGDGTVGEVLRGLDTGRVPFLILQTGTENLLARELRMPFRLRETARTLLHGMEVAFDLAMVNGRRFASLVGVGFDAECVQRLSEKRSGHITHFDYVVPIWRTFWAHRFPRLMVEADGELLFDGCGLVMVGNIGRYARNLRLLRDARWDDGLLDVVVFPCTTRWQLLVHAFRVLWRRHVGRGGVRYRQCRRMSVHAPEARVLVEVDGDSGGVLPIAVASLPGAARFLRLPGADGSGPGVA